MRLEKYIARCGVASRRTTQRHIKLGRVTVNGETVFIPGTSIQPKRDLVEFDGRRVEETSAHVYVMLNKPPGYITTRCDERSRPTVMELVRGIPERIYPVGRLDRDSEGLLLMTNDGDFAYALTHPRHEVRKRYIVWVKGRPSEQEIDRLRNGVEIEGGCTAPATLIPIAYRKGGTQFTVIIHEGKKRQIRRMFQAVQFEVISLKRVAIGALVLGGLPQGHHRRLNATEIESLRRGTTLGFR